MGFRGDILWPGKTNPHRQICSCFVLTDSLVGKVQWLFVVDLWGVLLMDSLEWGKFSRSWSNELVLMCQMCLLGITCTVNALSIQLD